jgi:hypothetical protein
LAWTPSVFLFKPGFVLEESMKETRKAIANVPSGQQVAIKSATKKVARRLSDSRKVAY